MNTVQRDRNHEKAGEISREQKPLKEREEDRDMGRNNKTIQSARKGLV